MAKVRSGEEWFRMGAAVAIGELLGEEPGLRLDEDAARSYLASFGIRGMDDVDGLGITGPYRRDFELLYRQDRTGRRD